MNVLLSNALFTIIPYAEMTMIDYSIRILVFITFFSSLIAWQITSPKVQPINWQQRWRNNLSLFGLDIIVVRLLQPSILALLALHLSNRPALHIDWIQQSYWLTLFLSIVILDMAVYWQHRVSHTLPFLWRFHKVHHSDAQIDVSSAIRFHPVEIALSLLYKGAIIYLFAIPVEAVLLFDIILNASAMFNHTNGKLPKRVDTLIRLFIVTPDMHRIHHSTRLNEANSNFGFFLSCWDRCFSSYISTPQNGDKGLQTGLPLIKSTAKEEPLQESLFNLLKMPFIKNVIK